MSASARTGSSAARLAVLLVVGVVGALLIGRSSTRPTLDVLDARRRCPAAYAGTAYAFDGLVCLRAGSIGARVSGVDREHGGGVRTQIGLRPPGRAAGGGVPGRGGGDRRRWRACGSPAGDAVRPGARRPRDGPGRAAPPGRCTVRFRYGPFGVFRTRATVTPPVVLQVTGHRDGPAQHRLSAGLWPAGS